MSEEECPWCEGAGCDECAAQKKKAAKKAESKGGSAKKESKPKTNCDWCEGAGCDECQKGDGGADGDAVCSWCEGAGCDECGGGGGGGGKRKCDFCDGAGCDTCQSGGGGGGKEELTLDVKIANLFYEAEDTKASDAKKAVGLYRKVIEMSKDLDSLSDENHTTIFKSMEAIVVLSNRLKAYDEMKSEYVKLLAYIPNVTRNEGSSAIDDVLNSVASGEFKALEEVYAITLDSLKKQKDAGRFVFDVSMKQCRTYVDKKLFRKAEEVLERLHQSCRNFDGTDNQREHSSELIDIYAMKIQIWSQTGAQFDQKDFYDRTKNLIRGVVSAKSQAVLRECWGKMFGDDGQWSLAKGEFWNAFISYQSSGALESAKECLKYAVVASMLNPEDRMPAAKDEKKGEKKGQEKATSVLDAKEAKQFENFKDVKAMGTLQKAHENSDVNMFMSAADEIDRTADEFIRKHLGSLIREFQGKAIVQLVRSYRRVRLDFIEMKLKITAEQVENLLIQLILDGEIVGVIDQVKGILDLNQRAGGGGKKYYQIDQWTRSLDRLTDHLEQPFTAL